MRRERYMYVCNLDHSNWIKQSFQFYIKSSGICLIHIYKLLSFQYNFFVKLR